VDGVGFDEWADGIRRAVVVPINCERSTVPVPRNRSDSRTSMIAYVSVAGRALNSVVFILRKTTEIEFYECEFTLDVVSLVWQGNGFCTAPVFEKWCLTIFPPDTCGQ
jgi:hypothetical protein